MENTLVPIFICAVLPMAIVYIVMRAKMNFDDKRAQVMLKAIETGNDIDADKLAEAFKKPVKSARETLNLRLLRGCIFSIGGLFVALCGLANLLFGDNTFGSDPVSLPLFFGGLALAIGISYLIVYFVTRRDL